MRNKLASMRELINSNCSGETMTCTLTEDEAEEVMAEIESARLEIIRLNESNEKLGDLIKGSMSTVLEDVLSLENYYRRLLNTYADAQKEIRRLQDIVDDYRDGYERVMNDQCPTDERHCGCVAILRRELEERKENENSK